MQHSARNDTHVARPLFMLLGGMGDQAGDVFDELAGHDRAADKTDAARL